MSGTSGRWTSSVVSVIATSRAGRSTEFGAAVQRKARFGGFRRDAHVVTRWAATTEFADVERGHRAVRDQERADAGNEDDPEDDRQAVLERVARRCEDLRRQLVASKGIED